MSTNTLMENIKPILEQTATSAQTYCEKCQPEVLLTEIETLLQEAEQMHD